jgi:Tfp pilus assembly protein PilN
MKLKFKIKTSLGIDISENQINVALLRQLGGEIELVKAASAPVPEGAITDGNITNPASLAGAIKQLLAKNNIRRQRAMVSLVAKPILTQIIDLPDEIPENLGQFVRTEIRHSPVLAGKEPCYDFCGLKTGGAEATSRVFVGATDNEKISTLLKTLSLADIEPKSVELAITASIRALYANRISNKYECNLLFGFIHGSVMTLCVFRKGNFDFIRYIDIGAEGDDSDKCIARCEDQINAVIQFYDIEVEDEANSKWEFAVALDNTTINAQDLEFSLQKKFGVEAHVCSSSTISADTALAQNAAVDQASITAVGLAMKRFEDSASDIKIDLLPTEAEDKRVTKRFILITANAAAIILLFMLVTAGIVRVKLGQTRRSIPQTQQGDPIENMEWLLKQQNIVEAKVAELSAKSAQINEIFEGDSISNWAGILDDLRYRMPATLCITSLSCPKGLSFEIEGQSLSYRSVHLFAELLVQSEFVKSATVAETNKNPRVEGLIAYLINCELADNKGLLPDADG